MPVEIHIPNVTPLKYKSAHKVDGQGIYASYRMRRIVVFRAEYGHGNYPLLSDHVDDVRLDVSWQAQQSLGRVPIRFIVCPEAIET